MADALPPDDAVKEALEKSDFSLSAAYVMVEARSKIISMLSAQNFFVRLSSSLKISLQRTYAFNNFDDYFSTENKVTH